jgi:hypothetical protein
VSVLGDHRDSPGHCPVGILAWALRAADADVAATDSAETEDRFEHFSPAGAHHADESDDFAGLHLQRQPVEFLVPDVDHVEDGIPALGLLRGRRLFGADRLDVTNTGAVRGNQVDDVGLTLLGADDRGDHTLEVDLLCGPRSDVFAVAEHGGPVRDPEYLGETVGHVDDADTAVLRPLHGLEEDLLLPFGEG